MSVELEREFIEAKDRVAAGCFSLDGHLAARGYFSSLTANGVVYENVINYDFGTGESLVLNQIISMLMDGFYIKQKKNKHTITLLNSNLVRKHQEINHDFIESMQYGERNKEVYDLAQEKYNEGIYAGGEERMADSIAKREATLARDKQVLHNSRLDHLEYLRRRVKELETTLNLPTEERKIDLIL